MSNEPQKLQQIIDVNLEIAQVQDLDVLLETFKRLQEKYKIYLLIVGGGSKKEIKKLKGVKNTKVTGFVTDVVPYLQAMDIFVMPSLTETTSLATLEAMACGLPVVATSLATFGINPTHGKDMFISDDYDVFSRHVITLLEDRKLREEAADNAIMLARKFDHRHAAEKLEHVIKMGKDLLQKKQF